MWYNAPFVPTVQDSFWSSNEWNKNNDNKIKNETKKKQRKWFEYRNRMTRMYINPFTHTLIGIIKFIIFIYDYSHLWATAATALFSVFKLQYI